jgi:septal ring factor EnvC (AmiA/AmiB activator)
MNERLAQLRAELEKGDHRLRQLDRERQEVRDTMLRISGAIRVLEELLEQSGQQPSAVDAPLARVA